MYWTLFLTFLKIGVGTIGGGYAMLPLIQREVVDRGWLSKEDFIDLFSVAQSLPGIFAVNISIFVGYKLKKRGLCTRYDPALVPDHPADRYVLYPGSGQRMGGKDIQRAASGRCRPDRSSLYYYGTLH